jgi:hypothetical protein
MMITAKFLVLMSMVVQKQKLIESQGDHLTNTSLQVCN